MVKLVYGKDQGSGQVVCVSLALILLAFAGASPVKFYSFVSAIKLQMRLKYSYKILWELCQALN
jgi:hypothetical protein